MPGWSISFVAIERGLGLKNSAHIDVKFGDRANHDGIRKGGLLGGDGVVRDSNGGLVHGHNLVIVPAPPAITERGGRVVWVIGSY